MQEKAPPAALSEADATLISDLQRHQSELGLGGDDFAKQHLSYSGTVWSRIVTGEYWSMVRDAEKVLSTLRGDLRAIETARLMESRYGAADFIAHPDAAEVLRAVRQCRAKPLANDKRLILYIAPTGGGKSSIAGRLRADGGRIVEARESWLRSYWTCIRDIARTCGVNPDHFYSPDQLEEELIRRLNARRQVLVIDEGEFFSARTLNLVKLLINKTTAVVVILCLPSAFDTWSTKNWHEAVQLRRRTHALIRMAPCDEETARLFLAPAKLDEGGAKAAAAFARDFGAFDTLAQIRHELDGEHGVDRSALIKAGNRIRACQGLHPLFSGR